MKEAKGIVLSAKMKRAVIVRLERLSRHPKYGKYIVKRTKVMARDDLGCREGDVVRIEATRPLSKLIRWRVIQVVGRALAADRGEAETETAQAGAPSPAQEGQA